MDSETEYIKEHLSRLPKHQRLQKLRVSMGKSHSDVEEFEKVTTTLKEITKIVLDKSLQIGDQPTAIPTLSKKFKETYPGLFDLGTEKSRIRLQLAIEYSKQHFKSLRSYDLRKIKMKTQQPKTATRKERLPRGSTKKSLAQAPIDPPSTIITSSKELTPQAGKECSTTPASRITCVGQLPDHFAVLSKKRKPSVVLKDSGDWKRKYVPTAEEGTSFRMVETQDELDSIPFDVQNHQRGGNNTESRCLSEVVLNSVKDVNLLAVETGLCSPTFDSFQNCSAAVGDIDFGSAQAVRKVNELKRPGQASASVPLGITRSALSKNANPALISQEEEEPSFSASLSLLGCETASSKTTLTPLILKPSSLISTSPLQRINDFSAERESHGSSLTSSTTFGDTSSRTYVARRTPDKAGDDFMHFFLQSCQVGSMIRLYDVLTQAGITEEYAREMGKSWTLSQIEDFLRKVFASSCKANGSSVTEIDIIFLAHRFYNYFRENSKKDKFNE